MADSRNKSDGATNSLGLKAFNRTGREDTTTEVLRPKTDPAVARRNMGLIALVIVAFLCASYFVFLRSGLDLRSITAETGKSFGTASDEASSKQNFDDKGSGN
jgi:hypothetical protein